MRHHLLVVSEKKIKNVNHCFCHQNSSITGGVTITFCAQTAHITNICMKSGLIIFNTSAVTPHRHPQEAGCRTQNAGRMTLSHTTPNYELTGELKIVQVSFQCNMWHTMFPKLFIKNNPNLQSGDALRISHNAAFILQIIALSSFISLRYLPQLNSFV